MINFTMGDLLLFRLVQFGANTTAEIKPGLLWWVLLEDFCRDLLGRSFLTLPVHVARSIVAT